MMQTEIMRNNCLECLAPPTGNLDILLHVERQNPREDEEKTECCGQFSIQEHIEEVVHLNGNHLWVMFAAEEKTRQTCLSPFYVTVRLTAPRLYTLPERVTQTWWTVSERSSSRYMWGFFFCLKNSHQTQPEAIWRKSIHKTNER